MVEPEDDKILPVIEFSDSDSAGDVEIAVNDSPGIDSGTGEDSGQLGTDDEADKNLEVRTSELPAESEEESGWIPSSICGLPGVILLFTFIVPLGKGMKIRSQNT